LAAVVASSVGLAAVDEVSGPVLQPPLDVELQEPWPRPLKGLMTEDAFDEHEVADGDAKHHAEFYGVPYYEISVSKENKLQAEAQQLELLEKNRIDLAVLARYMQVLSNDFIRRYPRPIINIHHSFLPAFVGAKPHQQAFQRGVKLIGATAHYVTEALDDGPIIEQGVARITHKDDVDDLVEKGRDLEKVVLSRAVRWHIENRILLHGNRTVIFE